MASGGEASKAGVGIMRGKRFALSAGVLAMTVIAGLPAEAGEAAKDGMSKVAGAAKELYRTYDGKSMNLQPRRVASRPPLPRRRPVSLPGRDLADAATLGKSKDGVKPAGGPEPAARSAQAKDKLDATASYEEDKGATGDGAATPRTRVNFRAKY